MEAVMEEAVAMGSQAERMARRVADGWNAVREARRQQQGRFWHAVASDLPDDVRAEVGPYLHQEQSRETPLPSNHYGQVAIVAAPDGSVAVVCPGSDDFSVRTAEEDRPGWWPEVERYVARLRGGAAG